MRIDYFILEFHQEMGANLAVVAVVVVVALDMKEATMMQ